MPLRFVRQLRTQTAQSLVLSVKLDARFLAAVAARVPSLNKHIQFISTLRMSEHLSVCVHITVPKAQLCHGIVFFCRIGYNVYVKLIERYRYAVLVKRFLDVFKHIEIHRPVIRVLAPYFR